MFFSTLEPIVISASIACFSSFTVVLFGEYLLLSILRRRNHALQPIRDDGPQEHKKKKVPTFGGIVIVLGIVVGSIASFISSFEATTSLTLILSFSALGFADDFLKVRLGNSAGLAERTKLALQFLFASVMVLIIACFRPELAVAPLFAPSFGQVQLFISALFAIFVIVGAANSVNFTDGLDGLAAGCTIPTSLLLGVYGFMEADPQRAASHGLNYLPYAGSLVVVLVAIAAACLGFLFWNRHPAKIFMGDTGSLALGAGLGIIAVLLRVEIVFGIAGFVFVSETLSVIIQRAWYKRTKKRVFRMAPLHHHFEAVLPETAVTFRFCLAAWLFAILATLPLV